MAGLILLMALVVLIALLIWLSGLLTRWLPLSENWKALVRVLVVVAAFPLMVADELIGQYQFDSLCSANGVESADVSRAQGKKVMVEYGERKLIAGTIMPIKQSDVIFNDANSGEILIRYKNYYAMGGWIMRYTPLGMGNPGPMLFGGSTCDVRVEQAIFKANSITLVYE